MSSANYLCDLGTCSLKGPAKGISTTEASMSDRKADKKLPGS